MRLPVRRLFGMAVWLSMCRRSGGRERPDGRRLDGRERRAERRSRDGVRGGMVQVCQRMVRMCRGWWRRRRCERLLGGERRVGTRVVHWRVVAVRV